jgi:hypothetical protein
MRDLRLDELSHVYGGGGYECAPGQQCKETNKGQEKKECGKESENNCRQETQKNCYNPCAN